ncbi:MAG TPA: ATP-dependent zinc metalloprotease FtsH [Actinomycetota bacterium]
MNSLRRWLRAQAQSARRFRRLRAGRRTKRTRTIVLLLVLVSLGGGMAAALDALEPAPHGERIRMDELDAIATANVITQATFRDEDAQIVGRYRCPAGAGAGVAACVSASTAPAAGDAAAPTPAFATRRFWMPYPKSDLATGALISTAVEAGARVTVDPQTGKAQLRMLTTFVLPLLILASLFALLFTAGRSAGSGIGDVIVFGSLRKGRARRGRAARVTFEHVAGAEHAVAEFREVVDYLQNPERYRDIGAQAPKGVLMIGPPGCGKTLLAKACAGEADVPFFSVAGAEFVESLVGVGAARVRDLFRRVRAAAPAIVFIDELDAAGRRRGSGGGQGGSDEREQTLNQLLVEMDGFDASAGIVVIGATNRPDILDPALLRPGRFDRHVTVDQPDRDGRREILRLHALQRRLGGDVDFELLARRTPGFSGAELAGAVNEAALLAIRAGKTTVGMEEMLEGIERVVSGPQGRGHAIGATQRRRIAAHEAGHAIVTASLGRADDVHRVSILRRGRTLGSVATDAGETSFVTRSEIRDRLAVLLAGVAAEEMTTGEPSTGAEADLEQASMIARDLVARYGMSGSLGRPRLLAADAAGFLGERPPLDDVAPETRTQIDAEVREHLADAERRAASILDANRAALQGLISRLETEETIDGAALQDALRGVEASAMPPPRRRARRP